MFDEEEKNEEIHPEAEASAAEKDGAAEDGAAESVAEASVVEPATEGAPAEAPAAKAEPEEGVAEEPAAEAEPEEGAAEAEPEAEAVDPALAAALEDAARWKDRAARLQADFDNYRKRQAREREDVIRQANADLLEELLPVLDQTDTAIAAVSKDATDASKPFLDGFELVRRTFLNAVAKFGLKPVESPVGKPLDPATSEALSVMKTGQAAPGCVVFESRKGYTLGGKLLRASQVVVEQED